MILFNNSNLQLQHKAEEGYYLLTNNELAEIYDVASRKKIVTLEKTSLPQERGRKFWISEKQKSAIIIKRIVLRPYHTHISNMGGMMIYDICNGSILRKLELGPEMF